MKSKIPTATTMSPAWFLLPIILAISGIAAIRHQSRLIAPPASPITTVNQKTQSISEATSFFYTQVFLDRDQTFISLPFRFPAESSSQPLWLLLMASDNNHLVRLIHHPEIATINWPMVESDGIFVYQRQKNYASLDQLIQSPPSKDTLLLDYSLKDLPWFTDLSGVTISPQNSSFNLAQIDYIVTTYHSPRIENEWSMFETTVDASRAQVNDKDELIWEIYAPLATVENPYLVGTIHVDYRQ
jgi:hypothetical protein